MIDFELSPMTKNMRSMIHELAKNNLRPLAREYDEKEHEKPEELINMMFQMQKASGQSIIAPKKDKSEKDGKPSENTLMRAILAEELTWGDAGLTLMMPGPGLGGAAVAATGTDEQKERFLKQFSTSDKPVYGAMAITEPHCGSDTSAITTTATRDGNEWVLNGEKIFVTCGGVAAETGFIVVWATLDKFAGRAGIKPFVVESGAPGMKVTKLEHKLGIRASETAAVTFENCRIPITNILGSAEVLDAKKTEGFKGVMATFDSTRPFVAALALGVARAALDFTKESFEEAGLEIRYGAAAHKLNAVERDIMDMEANINAARLLMWRACWQIDMKRPNNLEAAMCKAKAGLVVTQVTQKCCELLGPLGFSRKYLLEKWMRDAKINDIFEGTGQIQMLIVARRILGYGREQLK